MQKETPIRFIDTQKGLCEACTQLGGENIVAADLEADSMFHFTERICLIQLAAKDAIYIIDPLSLTGMAPLQAVMENPAVRKVFHGADYDVRCLYRDYSISIHNLFDTEIASRFLGYAETGLNSILKAHFGIHLEKKYQKKDWSQRPLPDEMVAYAADDVRYLIPLCMELEQELAEKGRLDWVWEECEALSFVRPETSGTQGPLFLRIKGAGRLDPRSLATLEELLHMRIEKARQKDRPPFKILSNTVLVELAQKRPQSLRALASAGGLSRKQIDMHGKEILSAIEKGLSLSGKDLPRYPRTPRPTQSEQTAKTVRRLKRWREKEAGRLGIDPGIFLSNARINALAEEAPESVEDLSAVGGMKNWQIREYGEKLIRLIWKKESA